MYPFHDLKSNEVVEGIINYLNQNTDKEKEGILHLDCGSGEFAKELHDSGFSRYHGTSANAGDIKAAKKLVPKFKTRFHKLSQPLGSDALKHKHDIILTTGSVDFEAIPSNQRLIVVTKDSSYSKVCIKLTPLFRIGATTVQHGDYFVTYGFRK